MTSTRRPRTRGSRALREERRWQQRTGWRRPRIQRARLHAQLLGWEDAPDGLLVRLSSFPGPIPRSGSDDELELD